MSRASAKSAGRSAKAAAGARKKSTKSARKSVKKASASASRRTAGKTTRPSRAATAARKPAAAKTAQSAKATVTKTVVAAAVKTVETASMKAVLAEARMIRTVSPPVQPAAPEAPVYPHKYRVGEHVYYTSPSFGRAAASGSYTVVKLLPSDGDDYQYRIKSSGEAFERVAKESQLDRV
jgi:hypothetical protein